VVSVFLCHLARKRLGLFYSRWVTSLRHLTYLSADLSFTAILLFSSKWNGIGFVYTSDLKPQKMLNWKCYHVGWQYIAIIATFYSWVYSTSVGSHRWLHLNVRLTVFVTRCDARHRARIVHTA